MLTIKLFLAKPRRKDISFLHHCFVSHNIRGNFQPCKKISEDELMREVRNMKISRRFIFIVMQGCNAIGYAYAHYIPAFGHYEIGVTLIPSARGRGIGTIVHRLLVNRMLKSYCARRLHAFVSSRNIAEIKTLESQGFRCEGVLREVGFLNGVWHDLVVYGFLSHEWRR